MTKSFVVQLETHFNYFWAHNRLINLSNDDEYLRALPRTIKRRVMTDFLFKDIFRNKNFGHFFHINEYKDTKFLYDVSFGFMPRRFDLSEDD